MSADKLLGAICAYLLVGVTWALLFALIGDLDPGAFRWPSLHGEQVTEASFSTYTYFSFVTLTTLGYGDVSPVSEIARRLALLEALLGQIYLAVLVARLVGLHLSQSIAAREAE